MQATALLDVLARKLPALLTEASQRSEVCIAYTRTSARRAMQQQYASVD